MLARPILAACAGCIMSAALVLLPAPLRAQPVAVCGAPAAGTDAWQIASPESAAVDGKRLCALIDWLDQLKEANVHGVVVIRRGTLLFEHYRKGSDERWGTRLGEVTFTPDVKHDQRSISKSVTSLLVGIALDRKLIASIDEPVYRFFPEYAEQRTPEKDSITLRHLLTMSSGIAWDETIPYTNPANSEIRMIFAPDPYRFVLEQPLATPPGEVYNYSGGSTALLGRIVQKVSGQPLEAFARTALFEPLGITDFEWVRMPSGDAAAASGVRLRPRDMAKLGQLVLQQGRWGDRQIVSAAWLQDSFAAHVGGSQLYFYGYQWWLGRSLVDRKEIQWAAGFGLGGQRIFIVPGLDLVVVVTGGMYASPMQGWVPLAILSRVLKAAG